MSAHFVAFFFQIIYFAPVCVYVCMYDIYIWISKLCYIMSISLQFICMSIKNNSDIYIYIIHFWNIHICDILSLKLFDSIIRKLQEYKKKK